MNAAPFRRFLSPAAAGLLAALAASGASAKDDLVYLKAQAVKVSSFDESPGGWAPPKDPNALVDGNLKTRWASKAEDGQWVMLNFGSPKTVSALNINWERAFAAAYAVEVSDDGEKWKRVFTQKNSPGGNERVEFKPAQATYLRLLALQRFNDQWGVSIWDLEPYGARGRNPGDKPFIEVFPWRTSDVKAALDVKPEKPVPSPGRIAPDEYQRGINYTSWHETDIASPFSDKTLKDLKARGVGHVALLTTWVQKTPETIEIYPQSPKGGMTPVDNAVKHAINAAHALGLKVMLKPHLDIEDGTYRGELFPKEGWFPNYAKFIKHYAKIAREFNVEAYCVGVELKGATTWEQEQNWRTLIKEVRGIYKGPLTYAANWDEYQNIAFWDEIDYIGIDAYFPLTTRYDASLEDIEKGWEARADEIETWLNQKAPGKPVLFTELGYPSVDGANVQPWIGISKVTDRQEQADCYEAAFRVLSKRPWFRGFYWWHYFPTDRALVEDLTVRGKLAETVMTHWYSKIARKGETKK